MSANGTMPGQGDFVATPEYLARVSALTSPALDAEDAFEVDDLEAHAHGLNGCELCSGHAVSHGLCKACLEHFEPSPVAGANVIATERWKIDQEDDK